MNSLNYRLQFFTVCTLICGPAIITMFTQGNAVYMLPDGNHISDKDVCLDTDPQHQHSWHQEFYAVNQPHMERNQVNCFTMMLCVVTGT